MLCRALIAGPLLMAASAAHGTVTCSVSSLDLNFGGYDPFSAIHLDGTTSVQVSCTTNKGNETAPLITLSLSTGLSGSYLQRQLRDGFGNSLNYNLYRDAARTQVFGDGTQGSLSFTARNVPLSKFAPLTATINVYGRIFSGQDPKVGSYADQLIYTITF